MRTPARPPPRRAGHRFLSRYAAMKTNSAACASPRCTHFMRVSERAEALISVVWGEEQAAAMKWVRSEEHTSELQSPDHLLCRLLLEKKKNILPRVSNHHT